MIRFALLLLVSLTFAPNAYSSTLLICNGKNTIAKYPNEKVEDVSLPGQLKVKIEGDTILKGAVGFDFERVGYKIISRSAGDELSIVGLAKHTINQKNTAPEIITIFGTEFDSAVSITLLSGHFVHHDTYKCRRL